MGPQSSLFLDLSIFFVDFLNILFDFIDSSIDVHDLPNVLEARKIRKLVPKAVGDRREPSGTVGDRRELSETFGNRKKRNSDSFPDTFFGCFCFGLDNFRIVSIALSGFPRTNPSPRL